MKLKICIIERESIKGVGGSLHKKSNMIVFYPNWSKLGIQLHLGPRYTFIKKKKRNIFKLLTLQASKQVFLTTTE